MRFSVAFLLLASMAIAAPAPYDTAKTDKQIANVDTPKNIHSKCDPKNPQCKMQNDGVWHSVNESEGYAGRQGKIGADTAGKILEIEGQKDAPKTSYRNGQTIKHDLQGRSPSHDHKDKSNDRGRAERPDRHGKHHKGSAPSINTDLNLEDGLESQRVKGGHRGGKHGGGNKSHDSGEYGHSGHHMKRASPPNPNREQDQFTSQQQQQQDQDEYGLSQVGPDPRLGQSEYRENLPRDPRRPKDQSNDGLAVDAEVDTQVGHDRHGDYHGGDGSRGKSEGHKKGGNRGKGNGHRGDRKKHGKHSRSLGHDINAAEPKSNPTKEQQKDCDKYLGEADNKHQKENHGNVCHTRETVDKAIQNTGDEVYKRHSELNKELKQTGHENYPSKDIANGGHSIEQQTHAIQAAGDSGEKAGKEADRQSSTFSNGCKDHCDEYANAVTN